MPATTLSGAARRSILLIEAGKRAADVVRLLKKKRQRVSRATVYAVLDGRFRNDAVIAAFCELTGAAPDDAFPEEGAT